MILFFVFLLMGCTSNNSENAVDKEIVSAVKNDADYQGTIVQKKENTILFVNDLNVEIKEELSTDEASKLYGNQNLILFHVSDDYIETIHVGDKVSVWSSGNYNDPAIPEGSAVKIEIIDTAK